MPTRFECSGAATLSGRVALIDSTKCSFLLSKPLSRRSSFTCSNTGTHLLVLFVIVAMESFRSRLKQKGSIVSFNPKGDGSCFFSAAAHQLKQDGACLKEATFEYLLSHRFDVSIFIVSHYEQRNR